MNESEKKKIFIMRVVIGSVAFIILILWAFNLKNVWQDARRDKKSSAEWTSLKNDLEKALGEAKDKMNKIEADRQAAAKKTGDNFLNGLLEEASKNASSSESIATSSPLQATSTSGIISASSTPKNISNCPPYIDCMPTIGAAKPCVIPAGCEGITQIAY